MSTPSLCVLRQRILTQLALTVAAAAKRLHAVASRQAKLSDADFKVNLPLMKLVPKLLADLPTDPDEEQYLEDPDDDDCDDSEDTDSEDDNSDDDDDADNEADDSDDSDEDDDADTDDDDHADDADAAIAPPEASADTHTPGHKTDPTADSISPAAPRNPNPPAPQPATSTPPSISPAAPAPTPAPTPPPRYCQICNGFHSLGQCPGARLMRDRFRY